MLLLPFSEITAAISFLHSYIVRYYTESSHQKSSLAIFWKTANGIELDLPFIPHYGSMNGYVPLKKKDYFIVNNVKGKTKRLKFVSSVTATLMCILVRLLKGDFRQ